MLTLVSRETISDNTGFTTFFSMLFLSFTVDTGKIHCLPDWYNNKKSSKFKSFYNARYLNSPGPIYSMVSVTSCKLKSNVRDSPYKSFTAA